MTHTRTATTATTAVRNTQSHIEMVTETLSDIVKLTTHPHPGPRACTSVCSLIPRSLHAFMARCFTWAK